jgi:PTS system N-acetylgalactosamine-specific IIA component
MNIIIVTGHGGYAQGMEGAYTMLAGGKETIHFVDYLKNETEEDLNKKYLELIKDNNVLFLCDLIGGTPYKVAAKLSATNPNVQVVTGANVGALIDSGMKMDKMSIQELAEYAKTRTLIHSTIFKMVKEEINNSDGI